MSAKEVGDWAAGEKEFSQRVRWWSLLGDGDCSVTAAKGKLWVKFWACLDFFFNPVSCSAELTHPVWFLKLTTQVVRVCLDVGDVEKVSVG